MLGSTVLEIAIGMIFIYLLLSLLCSAIGEYIEAKLNNRAKYLRQGIELLLNESKGGGIDLAAQLYAHGLIRPLYRDATQLPSYIPSRTFTLALWNLATGAAVDGTGGVLNDLKKIRQVVAGLPNAELKTALLTLIDEANGDIDRARKNIEDWYDAMMDRVSGWYKRHTSIVMIALGVVVAAIVNADTINIANVLARDTTLRSSIVAAAEQRAAAGSAEPSQTAALTPDERDRAASARLRQARADVDALGLPIGWVAATADNREDPRRVPDAFIPWLLKLCGIILTGFAISQGSPFWFDLLNRFIVVRSTVKPQEKSQQTPSKETAAPRAETRPEPPTEGKN